MSNPVLPLCACGEFYDSHHPECPARTAYEYLLSRADAMHKNAIPQYGSEHVFRSYERWRQRESKVGTTPAESSQQSVNLGRDGNNQ